MAGELGQQTVELGAVVRRAAEESYLALRELVEKSQAEAEGKGIGAGANGGWQRSDTEKKIDLLKFITRTRQRMLRLHVLAKWCQQVPLVHYCQQLGSTLNSHETCFTQTADWLFFMRDDLEKRRAPMFDVPSATEVMLTGVYQRLPRCIEDIGSQNKLSPDEEKRALRKLDASVRYKVLVTPRPKEVSNVSVTDGIAVFRVDGEFKVLLTLGYRGNVDLWRILHMELLVGEKKGPIKLDESRRFALGDDIERRMAASDNPFTVLYAILHEFCISLAMDTIIRQANVLRQGRWKDAIRSELISDSATGQTGNASLMQLVQDGEFDSTGFKIPGLKVNYWLDGKSTSTAEPDSSPFIRIEAGQEMQIKCQHSSFVLDPFTDKEANLSLDLSCIDVEQLILRAIACNRHTRLLNIQRQLCRNVQISQSPKDVILKRDVAAAKDTNKNAAKKGFSDCFGNEVLQGILPAIQEKTLCKTDQVYQQSQGTLRIPETILHGSDLMVMGFPHCANAYYLLMQLDKDFRPVFHLLETQCDASDKTKTNANADAKEAIRCNKINVGQMQVLKNESNTNPFDVKLQALQSILSSTDLMESDIPVQNGIEPLPLLPACSPSFSSIVDEVFEYECGSTAAQNHSLPPSSLSSTSHLNSLSVGIQGINPRAVSPMHDGGGSHTQAINTLKVHPSVSLHSYLPSNFRHIQDVNKSLQLVPSSNNNSNQIPVRSSHSGILGNAVSNHLVRPSTTTGGLEKLITAGSDGASRKRSLSDFLPTYNTVEADSIQKLVSDLRRLSNARSFACGMRRLIGVKVDDKVDDNELSTEMKPQSVNKSNSDASEKLSEQMRKTFRIEAVGLMSLWFSYGTMPMVHIVVEWEIAKGGCTMHVSPDQLWPHTKFLEDFVNGGEVASFLDCIRLTAGPLLALGGAIRPARMPVTVSSGYSTMPKQGNIPTQGLLSNGSSSSTIHHAPVPSNAAAAHLGSHNLHAAAMLSAAGRGGPGLVPSSLLPFDVSVVLRGPYWIRIIYRKKFSVDMRCFAGDQVWLQPATPPKGGPSVGGSLSCPQFRPFIMEHVAQGLNALEPNFMNATQASVHLNNNSGAPQTAPGASRLSATPGVSMSRPTSGVANHVAASLSRAGNAMLASSALSSGIGGASVRLTPGAGLPVHMKGELNTAFIGLGDDGGYGGGWVPLAALKKVLRGILKYLGVLWLFAQLPELLKEILGSILKDNEGALLNLDQEQPALRFYVGGYVFAVSVHRVQLLLQVLSVKRFHHQQQQQQAQSNAQEELAAAEINEICDYFSRRVASEPYDASRVASFITLLTLPISVLREFLKLIAWKKGFSQAHGDIATAQRARIELCLENHSGSVSADNTESSLAKSNIHHDRAHSSVEFALTFVLDHALIPQMNVAGGAAWLPYCISVRLRYSFGDNYHIIFLAMDGSHGGRACWLQLEEWERCKQKVARAVETVNGSAVAGEVGQGRLRMVAEMIQKQLQLCLQQLRDGPLSAGSTAS
ncbi:mediator of RNA polymerase II transcription subunit 14-like [Panicum miliaceum]|uniref:Mediator of RNA polymerase II transcription subunit 14 n=1 Tax=Panicum miliaceum TaxID=4540 RepID=A0A3L6TDA8_PANMI|nr:mediator of RNA polymerase II transcription subunit 14-like [Panicum miliaceum]